MKYKLFSLLAFCFAWPSSALSEYILLDSPSPQIISIKEAISLAKKSSLELKKNASQKLEAKAKLYQNVSKVFPELTLRSNLQSENKPLKAQSTLELKVPLVDPKNFMSIAASKDTLTAAELSYLSDCDNLIYKVTKLYAEALLLQSVLNVLKESIQQYERQVSIFENKVRVGSMSRFDALESLYELKKTRSELLLKELEYKRKLGELGSELALGESFLLQNYTLDSPYFTYTPQELMDLALNTPDLRSLKQEISAYRTLALAESFEFLPKIFGSIENSWAKPLNGTGGIFSQNFMLNLNWQLFSLSPFASRKLNQIKQSTSEYTLSQKTAQKRLSINAALETLKTYSLALENSESTLSIAQESTQSAERLYAKGEVTGLDLMDAHARIFKVRAKLEEDKLRISLAKLNLLFLIGKISEAW
jgi:outer membrane protein TolC